MQLNDLQAIGFAPDRAFCRREARLARETLMDSPLALSACYEHNIVSRINVRPFAVRQLSGNHSCRPPSRQNQIPITSPSIFVASRLGVCDKFSIYDVIYTCPSCGSLLEVHHEREPLKNEECVSVAAAIRFAGQHIDLALRQRRLGHA